MKVAIATDDGLTVADHVGRCEGFVVCTIEHGRLMGQEYRANLFTHHQHHEVSGSESLHDHSGIISGLGDCSTIIARGMGMRFRQDLARAGKELCLTSEAIILVALERYLNGDLEDDSSRACTDSAKKSPQP